MNKVVKNTVAALAFAGVAGFGMTACGNQGYDDTQYVYVHGYYDHYHHYHTYSHPHRVTVNYYNHHKSSYPKPYKTTTVRKHSTSRTGSTVNKMPKRLGSGSGYNKGYKSGGSAYSRKRTH